MSLLRSDPLVIFQMTGNSRSGVSPTTYLGVTAVSSMTIPAALALAFAVCPATSSSEAAAILAMAAISSRSANKPEAMGNLVNAMFLGRLLF